MLRRLCALALACVLTLAVAWLEAAEHTKDTLATIKQNIEDEKAVLVDVREKKEWDAGHIEGAIFLPLSAVQDGLSKDELKSLPKDKVLYVHCVVGKRALTADFDGCICKPIDPGSFSATVGHHLAAELRASHG